MEPLYTKIDIITETDLPKVNGEYWAYHKLKKTVELVFFGQGIKDYWLNYIGWYFQPISEEEVQNILCIYPRIKL
jgi:hypothetical protein